MRYLLLFLFISVTCLYSQDSLIKPVLVTKLLDSKFNEYIKVRYHKGKIYFPQYTLEHDVEMWVSDGTPEGTNLLIEIDSIDGSHPQVLEERLDRLIFHGYGHNIKGIWSTDGTEEGTIFLDSVMPGARRLINFKIISEEIINDKVIFIGSSYDYGVEMWASDGTKEGTYILNDINKDGSMFCNNMYNLGNRIIFLADFIGSDKSELWSTDGTKDGTFKLTDFYHHEQKIKQKSLLIDHYVFAKYRDKLVFTSRMDGHGNHLWITDGTKEGTSMITDTNAEESGFIYISTVSNDKLHFITRDSTGEHSLWTSDGTKENTAKKKSIISNETYYNVDYLLPFKNKVIITHSNSNLFLITDGEESTELELFQLFSEYESPQLHVLEDKIIYRERFGKNWAPWVSDGTKDGSHIMKGGAFDFLNGYYYSSFLKHLDKVVFNYYQDSQFKLLAIDGSEDNIIELITNPYEYYNAGLINSKSQDSLLFLQIQYTSDVRNYEDFFQLWQTDLTKEKTYRIAPSLDDKLNSILDFDNFFAPGDDGNMYFFADYESTGPAIWSVKISSKDSVINNDTIPNMNTDLEFELYPNPASDFIKLKLSKPTHLFIVNLLGQKIMDLGIIKEENVNVSALYSGVYFITDNKWTKLNKFVKE